MKSIQRGRRVLLLAALAAGLVCLFRPAARLRAGDAPAGDVPAAGVGYALDWWTVDGGGGALSGGAYTLMGTAGQPDAGPVLEGGGYALVGGFWNAAAECRVYLPLVLLDGP